MKTKAWSLAGKLNYARHAHTTFFDGQKFVVAGGLHWDKASVFFSRPKVAQVKNEVCTLNKVRLQSLSVFRTFIFILSDNVIFNYTKSKNMTCEVVEASLTWWRYYPEYFLVDDDYGKDCLKS